MAIPPDLTNMGDTLHELNIHLMMKFHQECKYRLEIKLASHAQGQGQHSDVVAAVSGIAKKHHILQSSLSSGIAFS